MNPERRTEGLKGVAKVRTKATIKRLQMYRNFKAKRDKVGIKDTLNARCYAGKG